SVVYAVECIDVLPDGWVRVDHHRPGDPGHGRPPAEFMAASSIGQVIVELARLGRLPPGWPRGPLYAGAPGQWLLQGYRGLWTAAEAADCPRHHRGVVIPDELIYTAAADHCFGAAYRGACPGVDPDALMRWRVAQRAAFQGRDAGQILDDIERARDLLSDPDTVELAPGIRVVDVRGYCVVTHDCGHKELQHEDYTTHLSHKHGCPGSPYTPRQWCNGWTVEPGIPELPDAAAR